MSTEHRDGPGRRGGAMGRLVTRMTIGVRDRRADLEENVRVSLRELARIVAGRQW